MKPFIKSLLFSLVSLYLVGGTAPLFAANKDQTQDKNQPAIIEADSLSHNEKTQTQIAKGNVSLTRGSLVAKAQQLEATTDEQGNQKIVLQGDVKQLVSFKQKRDGVDEYIDAQAVQMTMDGKSDTIVLQDMAILRRYVAGKLQDEVRGASIRYNQTTQFYEVKGGASSSQESGRVRVVLGAKAPSQTQNAAPQTGK